MSHVISVTVCIRYACLVGNQSDVKQPHCHLRSRECCSAGTARSVATTSPTHFYCCFLSVQERKPHNGVSLIPSLMSTSLSRSMTCFVASSREKQKRIFGRRSSRVSLIM